MKYAGEVRDLSLATGGSAQESSRLLQVLDDYQITAGDVTAGMRAMKEQGIVPTVDALAQMSDQFLAIEDPAKRLQFAQDNLGRSSAKFLNVLSQGGDKIRELNANVSQNNILTNEQVAQTEEYRLAVDAVGDAWQGAQIKVTFALAEVITGTQELGQSMREAGEETNNTTLRGQLYAGILDQTRQKSIEAADATAAHGDALSNFTPAAEAAVMSLEELTTATNEVSSANMGMIGLMQNLQSETENYRETAADLHEQQDALRQDFVNGGVDAEEYAVKMGELTDKVRENEAAHIQAGKEIMFSLIQQKMAVGGLSDAEFKALTKIGVGMELIDQHTVDMATAMAESADNIAGSTENIHDAMRQPIADVTTLSGKVEALGAKSGQMWDFYYTISGTGSFPSLPAGTPGSEDSRDPRVPHATGGEFVVPSMYGNEGFDMGGIATASGGETIRVTPRSWNAGDDNGNGTVINIQNMYITANNANEFMMSLQGEL